MLAESKGLNLSKKVQQREGKTPQGRPDAQVSRDSWNSREGSSGR